MFEYVQPQEVKPQGVDQEDANSSLSSPKNDETTVSQHLEYYRSKLEFMDKLISEEYLQKINEEFHRCQIYYRPDEPFKEHFEARFKSGSVNREVMVLTAKWGHFTMEIKILNIAGSTANHQNSCDQGSFGFVFKGKFRGHNYALKCITIKSPRGRQQAVKEYFLLRIASVLEIGPRITPMFGFDMMMADRCADFGMEICQKVTSGLLNENIFFWNLALMHRFQIVHLDIKPENIMLSHSFKKLVFIDFGLSRIISERVGENSLTRFTGSANFCSPEMMACFFEQKDIRVDLFYNDLFCLEGTIKNIKNRCVFEDEDQSVQSYQIPQELPYFSYFSLALIKFFLFKNQITLFWAFWSQLEVVSTNLFREEVLKFLLELLLTSFHEDIFKRLSSQKDSDTLEYKMIKIITEMGHYTVYPVEILVDQEKLSIFTRYSNEVEFILDQDQQDSKKSERETLRQLVMSPALIKKISFQNYVMSYLSFMSYTNNICSIDSQAREAAALVYQQLFLIPSSNRRGRALIEATIRHLYEQTLKNDDFVKNVHKFILFAHRINDFLSILDIGTSEQYINLLNRLLQKLSLDVKKIFLNRVNMSAFLNIFRITPKGDLSRKKFIREIQRWIQSKKKQIIQQQSRSNQVSFSQASKKGTFIQSASFFDEFGQESIQFLSSHSRIMQKGAKRNIKFIFIQSFTKIINKDVHPRWPYFSLKLFQNSIEQRSNFNLCKAIYTALKETIADQSLLQEFSFDFQLQLFEKLNKQIYSIDCEYLDWIEQYLLKIRGEDIVFLKSAVFFVFYRIRINQTYHFSSNKAYCYATSKLKFIERTFLSNVSAFTQEVTIQNQDSADDHKHLNPASLMNLFSTSKYLVPSRENRVQEMIDQVFSSPSKCLICERTTRLILRVNKIQAYLTQCCKETSVYIQTSVYIGLLFKQLGDLQLSIKEKACLDNSQIEILEKGLYMGALVCCLDPQLQTTYHGLINLYHFAKKYSRMAFYFTSYLDNNFTIKFTLELLYNKHPASCAEFLVEASLVPERSFRQEDLQTLQYYTFSFFVKFSNERLLTFYNLIVKYHSDCHPQSDFVTVLFIGLYNCCDSEQLEKKICAAVAKRIHHIHFKFYRQLAIKILLKYTKRLKSKADRDEQQNRKWRFCNNQLVKGMSIIGKGTCSEVKQSRAEMRGLLLKKVSRIERIKTKQLSAKYVIK